jgi:membrane protein YdbS with pleckstrin-like domain
VALERVEAGIAAVILAVVLLAGAGFAGVAARFGVVWWWGSGIACLVWVFLTVWMLAWPPIHHRHVRWRLDDTGLEIQRGVYWRHILSVPLARLQHADLAQGPLQRQWGLARLIVYTAGTQHASVELEGLAYETAVGLRDHLLQQLGTRDVV